MSKIKNFFKKVGLISNYNVFSLFLFGFSFWFLLLINSNFRSEAFLFFQDFYEYHDAIRGVLFTAMAVLLMFGGLLISAIYSFSNEKMEKSDADTLILFAVVVEILVGLAAGHYLLRTAKGLWAIFPIMNIINALLLFIFWRQGIVDGSLVINERPERREIILGISAILTICFISNFLLNNYWVITFSVCLVYIVNVHNIFNKEILKIKKIKT